MDDRGMIVKTSHFHNFCPLLYVDFGGGARSMVIRKWSTPQVSTKEHAGRPTVDVLENQMVY